MSEKRTKIVCTIGPASEKMPTLVAMIRAGMNVARLNFSHGAYEHHEMLIKNIREASKKTGKTIAVLQDLQGPKIRVGKLPAEGIKLLKGTQVTLSTGVTEYADGMIPVQYKNLHRDVKKDDRILLDDGNMEVAVKVVQGQEIRATVILGGTLISYKGITVPTASLSTSAISEKDEKDLAFGLTQHVDFVALSFVRRAADIEHLRKLIKKHLPRGGRAPQVIAKIEKHEALVHLDEIIAATDGIMVARGDLALETKASEVPLWQKTMIQKSLEAAKPVITATQMLDSMTRAPRPTRAEISDVANAAIDHTDATMLSQESAMGEYPVETVSTMSAILADTERSPLDDFVTLPPLDGTSPPVLAMSNAACQVAKAVGAQAILVTTRSGFTARAVSRHRPLMPIFAITESDLVQRQLALSWGVEAAHDTRFDDAEGVLKRGVALVKKRYALSKGSRIVVVSGLQAKSGSRAWDEVVRVVEV